MKKLPPPGTNVWLIKTTHGFIDSMRYKTQTALMFTRNYFWKTEKGARQAFATIEDRFPKLGPTFELCAGTITEVNGSLDWRYAAPVRLIDTKTV